MEYLYHIVAMVCVYALLASSLNVATGFGGMLSLTHAGLFGVGAYVFALLTIHAHAPFSVAAPTAALATAALSVLFALAVVRLRGDQFLLATLALQILLSTTFLNWTAVTGGPFGVPGIPRPVVLEKSFSVGAHLILLVLAITITALGLLAGLARSAFLRDLRAVRDDWQSAEAVGISPERTRVIAFGISGAFAGLAGVIYAGWLTFVDPPSFSLAESILILVIAMLGGLGSSAGPILGAVLLVALPEVLRFTPLPDAAAANLRQILYGVVLLLVVSFRPRGLIGAYCVE